MHTVPLKRLLPSSGTPAISGEHRPYPAPGTPWIMHQSWHDLLFAHWPIDAAVMRTLVPDCMNLDTYNGQAWIGVVPFRMSNVRPRFVPPFPGISAFPELNVRTYVNNSGKPGVYFFSLDAATKTAVSIARKCFHLPYFHARMQVRTEGARVIYSSFRHDPATPPAVLKCQYSPVGPVRFSAPGTLEYWLTERYCLYTTNPEGTLFRCEIHHAQWPLQSAEAVFQENSMAAAAGVRLPEAAPLLHFAKRVDVRVWTPGACDCQPSEHPRV